MNYAKIVIDESLYDAIGVYARGARLTYEEVISVLLAIGFSAMRTDIFIKNEKGEIVKFQFPIGIDGVNSVEVI